MGKLEDLLKSAIGDPNIVVRVDAQAVRFEKTAFAPGREQFSGRSIKAENRGRDDWLSFVRGPGIFRAMKNKHMVVGIDRYSRNLAKNHAIWENRPAMNHDVRLGRFLLRSGRYCKNGGEDNELSKTSTGTSAGLRHGCPPHTKHPGKGYAWGFRFAH